MAEANEAAETAARQKRRAETEAKSKAFAEERRQKWNTQSTAFSTKSSSSSELTKKLSAAKFKIFGFDGGEDAETDADGDWGFNDGPSVVTSATKEEPASWRAEPAHDHAVLGNDQIEVTVPMPMGLSLGKDKVGGGYHVKLMSSNGNAIKTGKIEENMKVLTVNGIAVEGLAKSVVLKNIRKNKEFCALVLQNTHVSVNPKPQEVKVTVHGTTFGGGTANQQDAPPATLQQPRRQSKGGKAKAKVTEWFNTLRRKKLQAGEINADNHKDVRVVVRTMEFGPTSEFESVQAGDELNVVREFPDHSLLCLTDEGKVLVHADAFVAVPDEMAGLELDMFDRGAEEA